MTDIAIYDIVEDFSGTADVTRLVGQRAIRQKQAVEGRASTAYWMLREASPSALVRWSRSPDAGTKEAPVVTIHSDERDFR